MRAPSLSIPDLSSQFPRFASDRQLRLWSVFERVLMAAAAPEFLVFVGDRGVHPVPQTGLRIGIGHSRAQPLEQVEVEYPAIEVESSVRCIATTIGLMRHKGGVPNAMIWIADTDLRRVDAELHHPVLDMVIHWLGIPLCEVAGVLRWIVPHRSLGRRRADHRGLEKEVTDSFERIGHPETISPWLTSEVARGVRKWNFRSQRTRRNQADLPRRGSSK